MTQLPEHYRDRVVNDDVMAVLRDLPDECVDMIYGDPDYNAGISYDGRTFTASWDEYVEWYIDLARESLRVLRADGNLFFINISQAERLPPRLQYLDQHAIYGQCQLRAIGKGTIHSTNVEPWLAAVGRRIDTYSPPLHPASQPSPATTTFTKSRWHSLYKNPH